jgi:phosphatidylserine/phosphatidylglycerophosphate/cardiolipin synthase-like enzyme
MPFSPEALYTQIGQLITDMPDLRNHEWNTPAGQRWLGRAIALVEESGNTVDAIAFKVTAQGLTASTYSLGHDAAVQKMTSILYHALAVAELRAPAIAQNGFIPVGEPFTALAAVAGVISGAVDSILFIDPYADSNLLTDFAIQAPEQIAIKILTDSQSLKPGLPPAVRAWERQYGTGRPINVRLTSPRSLHDRLIIVDSRTVWSLGQSFNALATRSPTALVRLNEETALLKVQAYELIWSTASSLS